MQIIRVPATILLCLFMTHLAAQWEWENADFSNLDLGYPLDGFLTLDNDEHSDYLIDMLIQPDGKTLLFGSSQNTSISSRHYVLLRLDINGVLDTTFGEAGIVTLPNEYHYNRVTFGDGDRFILQPTGKIVLVGGTQEHVFEENNDILLLRYNSEGYLDSSFGEGGKRVILAQTSTVAYLIHQQSDEKLVLAGHRDTLSTLEDFFLFRCFSDGSVDTTFGEKGYIYTDFGKEDYPSKIISQSDGKLLVLGKTADNYLQKSDFIVARYLPDGRLDETFGNKGKVITTIGVGRQASARSGVLQSDGKIILAGSAEGLYKPDYAMVRYHANGQLDKSFGNQGKVITNVSQLGDVGSSIIIQPDGKILLAGNSDEWASHLTLLRYDNNGRLDYSFGDKGKQRPYFSIYGSRLTRMRIQEDKVILVGNLRMETRSNHDFLVLRFLSDFKVSIFNPTVMIANEVGLSPNPTKGLTVLTYTLENREKLTIQLVDIKGRNLKTYCQNKVQQKGSYQQQIDLPTDLSTGMYFLRLASPNGQVMLKIVR